MGLPTVASPSFIAGLFIGTIVSVGLLAAEGWITLSDFLSFSGSMLGAAGGIAAAFLAVYLSQHSADKRDLETLRDLLTEFGDRAAAMEQDAFLLNPVPVIEAALVHFRATRDAAIGMRTRGANVAKVAAQLETDQVGNRLNQYHDDGHNVQAPAVQAWAREMRQLGQQLLAVLENSL